MEERRYTIKELRARKDITQKQAAEDLGVTVQTYNAWEKDISNGAIRKVMAIADYYGVKLDQIFLRRNMN